MPKVRTRTFNGCLTCRSRKVKCDQNRPSCRNCQRLKLECQGYGVQLHWQTPWHPSEHQDVKDVLSAKSEDHNVRSRTVLFEGETGRQWSERLAQQIDDGGTESTVDQTLTHLEDLINDQDQFVHDWQCSLGPFGALKIEAGEDVLSSPADDEYVLQVDSNFPDEQAIFQQWLNSPNWSQDTSGGSSASYETNAPSDRSANLSEQGPSPVQQRYMTPKPELSALSHGSPYLPRDVRFLMSHYTGFVIDSLACFPTPKAPWKGLHVPCALSAVAELDFLGRSDLARVSVLYSLLSLASFHLSALYETGSPVSSADYGSLTCTTRGPGGDMAIHWTSQARKYREIARVSYHKCVRSVLKDGKSSVKYKELLMAAMNLVCTSIVSDDSWDARYYIIQCENIVREIGHAKPRFSDSSVRLHQIMIFVQCFEQTTFLQSNNQYQEKIAASYAPITEKVNLLEFMPGGPASLSTQDRQGRLSFHEMGIDGSLQAEKFVEMYGFDLQLLFFISRINKLAGLLDEHIQKGSDSGLPSTDLVQEAASLEEELCSWTPKSPSSEKFAELVDSPDDGAGQTPTAGSMNSFNQMRLCMTTAIHQSLIIYFFRCVRHTNPLLIQQYIIGILDNLEMHSQTRAENFPDAILGTIVWPAFIAACDALSSDLRTRALQCLRKTKTSGFRNAETAEKVVREVWRRRDQGAKGVNWRDVIRDMNVVIVLT